MNSAVVAIATPEAHQLVKYETACRAIAECDRVDECKGWADKSAAIAAYARQAKDDTLRVMAVRIQARAERRMGELLKRIPPDESTRYGKASPHPPVQTRSTVAASAGLSDYELKRALRVASVPEPVFTAQVESPQPPSVRRLADQGTAHRTPVRDLAGYADACRALQTFARFCESHEPATLAHSITADDAEAMQRFVTTADQWLDRFVTNLSAAGW